jgi:type I restriction enzyme S subunit
MKPTNGKLRLGDITRFVSGGTPSKQVASYWGGKTPWVSAKDLKSLHIDSSIDTLSTSGRDVASLVPQGTLLILVRGMTLFKSIPIGIASRELAINQDLKGLITNDKVSPVFLAYSLLAKESELLQMVEAAGHGTGRLDTDALKDILVKVPHIAEQNQIANAISTWDTAIQKTEQLIAAKERSSKALMQRVFRAGSFPRRRLSEFTSRVTRKNVEGDGHPLTISGAEGLVSQSGYFGKRIAAEKTEHYTLLKRGEYAYNKSYSAGYPLGAIKRLDGLDEGIVSTLYLCFALNRCEAPMSDYFAHFCEAGGFNHQIYQVAQEGARNHGLLNVTADDFFSMAMPIPPLDVQQRVVKVLGAAMQELALLRGQLAALRTQKRGLMQKLLTGQWRLPVQQESATA